MLNKPFYLRLSGVVLLMLFTALLCRELSSHAAPGPQPPCGIATFPPYPDLEKSPAVRVWERAELGRTVRYLLMPLFRPGDMQSIYFLERESQDVWRYYSIVRISKNARQLTGGNEASAINRAVAFYRYLAGIPTDMEPPASP
jgi:hypothetical protein